ncbi:GNAT family N-acetyltransferase [Nocardioides sp.]|uniref:GNAT family N-acetyltransferase n=1 Tax=Nocardioides sp. TaxID=35761 RepID=UPI003D0FEA8C
MTDEQRPTPPDPGERDQVLDLIVAQQADPTRNIPYLGATRIGIEAELADLEPPWHDTVRVARDGARIVGVALAEWDLEAARAWILGPWVSGDDAAWERWARPVFDAAAAQIPAAITDREISGDVANARLAGLGTALGWEPGVINHVFVADAGAAGSWPADSPWIRPVTAADLPLLEPLHDLEFPRTYASTQQLVDRSEAGTWTVLVAEHDGVVQGYAAGREQPDGDGYLDYVAVAPEARGLGLGAELVTAISRRLIEISAHHNVNLTVQDPRLPARRLYEKLGFRLEVSIQGYRSTATP